MKHTIILCDLCGDRIFRENRYVDQLQEGALSITARQLELAAISHHRKKNPDTGYLEPVSEYAKFCDKLDRHVMQLIHELSPQFWFVENPRGGMRKTEWMQGLPRYTVTYCQYGDIRMKPTDIWTNHPNPQFKPMCKNGDSCHERAPRGSRTGTQGLKGAKERSRIPKMLCEHIVDICEQGSDM